MASEETVMGVSEVTDMTVTEVLLTGNGYDWFRSNGYDYA